MSTNVELTSRVEHGAQTTEMAPSPTSSINSPKVSKFATKAGFVIPRNKLSGSLIPVLRGGKKQGGNDAESKENNKQVLRKTKWGHDLTQDASVRKGRALAYQTRVDQITQLLSSGMLEVGDNEDSPEASQNAGNESSGQQEILKQLELEKRDAIGEILKLNPSYKAPADYKPLLKEAKVSIPIKEYPGYNFIGLIFGPAGDTQKRLEKETGVKIRVYGTKADTKKEVEIKLSDVNETKSGYEELYVHVSAETYEKVDAAVSLIEMVVIPVSVNNVAASTASVAVSGVNMNSGTLGQAAPASFTFMGSKQALPMGQFQHFPTPWFSSGGPPSGYINPQFPNTSAPIFTNSIQVSSSQFVPQPVLSAGTVPQNPPFSPSGRPPQVLQRPYMLQGGPPMQSSTGQPKFSGHPPPFTTNTTTSYGPNQNIRPLTSAGWSQAPPSLGPNHMQPMMRSQGPPLLNKNTPGNIPSWPSPSQPPSGAQQPFPPNLMSGSLQIPPPVTSASMLPSPATAPKPLLPSSNNFTFQPHRPQNSSNQAISGTGSQPRPHIMPPQNLTLQPPHSPSFGPGMSSPGGMQGFSRPPQLSNQMNQPQATHFAPPSPHHSFHGGPNPGPQMGPRHFTLAPQDINPAGPFSPRPGNAMQHQQNYQAMGSRPQNLLPPPNQQFSGNTSFPPGGPAFRPSRPPHQIYDPFSPTSAPPRPQLGGNQPNLRKQESDPEYDDLMASVGVK